MCREGIFTHRAANKSVWEPRSELLCGGDVLLDQWRAFGQASRGRTAEQVARLLVSFPEREDWLNHLTGLVHVGCRANIVPTWPLPPTSRLEQSSHGDVSSTSTVAFP